MTTTSVLSGVTRENAVPTWNTVSMLVIYCSSIRITVRRQMCCSVAVTVLLVITVVTSDVRYHIYSILLSQTAVWDLFILDYNWNFLFESLSPHHDHHISSHLMCNIIFSLCWHGGVHLSLSVCLSVCLLSPVPLHCPRACDYSLAWHPNYRSTSLTRYPIPATFSTTSVLPQFTIHPTMSLTGT